MNNKNFYPDGKLNENYEGATLIAIGLEKNVIRIDFGKEAAWIELDKSTALALADSLVHFANKI